MLKLLRLLVVVLLMPAELVAQTWYPANQKTIAWDAVTTMTSGGTVPSGDTVKYQVWTKRGAEAPVKAGYEITATQAVVTLPSEGRFLVGAQAVRYPAGETIGQPSAVTWSDSADVVAVPSPFGLFFFQAAANVKNFRPVNP